MAENCIFSTGKKILFLKQGFNISDIFINSNNYYCRPLDI